MSSGVDYSGGNDLESAICRREHLNETTTGAGDVGGVFAMPVSLCNGLAFSMLPGGTPSGVAGRAKFFSVRDWSVLSSGPALLLSNQGLPALLDNFPHGRLSKLPSTSPSQSPLHAIAIRLQLFSLHT